MAGAERRDIILAADRLIDGSGVRLPAGSGLRIAGGIIRGVGAVETLDPESAQVLVLPGASLLPGLIDCHAYLSVDPNRPDPMGGMHGEDLVERAFITARHLAVDLASGVTTMRVMGEGHGLDSRARRAIEEGVLGGPRLLCSGTPVCPSFSHQAAPSGGADGVEAVRAAVRRTVGQGADWIKLVVTGGVNAPGERATTALYTEAEIAVAMAEARVAGVPVAVAAHGGPSVRLAASLGARSFEHCAFFGDDELDAAAEHGATLVLTLARFFLAEGIERSGRDVPGVLPRLMRARARLEALVPKALERGVGTVLGTDNMHGLLPADARLFVGLGAGNADAIRAVTGAAADAMGIGHEAGRLAEGLRADLVIVAGNPLTDIACLSRPLAVLQSGRVVHGHLAG